MKNQECFMKMELVKMMAKMKLVSLTLVGTRKNYVINFKDGFNYISGHTSTGKTSILEMIDYALGSKKHKSYIEIGFACTRVELILFIGDEKFLIKRQLFNFKAAVIVEEWNQEKEKFLFYNHFEIDTPSNPKSLSSFLIEKMGLTNITISGQTFSFRDLYKYCYIKQTEIDNEDILGEKTWEKNFKRKATFEILFNIYDETLEKFKTSLEEKTSEAKELEIKLSGIEEFLKTIDVSDLQECIHKKEILQKEINKFRQELLLLKKENEIVPNASMELRKRIEDRKNNLEKVINEKSDQEQYLDRLRLLYNQYNSEIEKKELAIEGYIAFNQCEFLFCPNCLKPIERPKNIEVCCLCGSEKYDDKTELIMLKKEISSIRRKSNDLLRFIDEEDKKYDEILKRQTELKNILFEEELELQHLSQEYINPALQQIEYINYEIGKKSRLILELDKDLKMFEEVERYQKMLSDKKAVIKSIKNNIKTFTQNAIDKEDLMSQLSKTFETILLEMKFPKLNTAYIDDKSYLPYVRGRKYDDIGSLAAVTMVTIAYYLSIALVGSKKDFHHPHLLIIDSPRKNLGAQAAKNEEDEFKDEKIFNAIIKFLYETTEKMKDSFQLIVVNNGYPEFLSKECIIAEFDSDGREGLARGLIDDASIQ